MRKRLSVVIVALVIAASLPIARAEDADKKFEVTGDLRLRYERLDNYFDFDNDADDLFSFFPYRARIGVMGQLQENVQVVVEIQNVGSSGNEAPAQALTFPPFQHFDGDGSTSGNRPSETSLYQGKVILNKVGGSNLSLTLGRQEYSFGTGLIIGNEEFYAGTVFDGGKGVWSGNNWNLTGFYFKITERQDPTSVQFATFGSRDANMYGVHWDYKATNPGPSMAEAYLIRYTDGEESLLRPSFYTAGAHWWRTVRTTADANELHLDWNAELAFQRGTAHDTTTDARLDLRGGYICNDSVGWNFVAGDAIHRVYGAYIRQSGDDDVTDDEIQGWISLFPAFHGLYGMADFDFLVDGVPYAQNEAAIQAYSLGYSLNLDEGKHMFGARFWKFDPVEDHVLLIAGDPKVKFDSYGTEIDLTYDFRYSKQVTIGAGLAQLRPRDGLAGAGIPDDYVTRGWGQIDVRF